MNPELMPIFARRSVRVYLERKIEDRTIRDLLEAAMAAPSAVATDPWEFVVTRDKSMLSRIAEGLPNGKMLATAPLGIVVCGDRERAHDGQLSYMLQDCSAAVENTLLAASMLGLGACWLGIHPREERVQYVSRLLSLPENVVPVAALAIGWPAEEKEPRTRFDPERVHWGQWQ